jgi:hypothetical protein
MTSPSLARPRLLPQTRPSCTPLPILVLVAVTALAVVTQGCGEAAPAAPPADGGTGTDASGGTTLQLTDCQTGLLPSGSSGGQLVRLHLTSDQPLTLSSSSRVRVDLFASDDNVADAAATLVGCIDAPAAPLPLDVAVVLPDDAAARVAADLGTNTTGQLSVYFAVDIDADGDGRSCPGDYTQVFGPDGPPFYTPDTVPADPVQVAMGPYTPDVCSPLSP